MGVPSFPEIGGTWPDQWKVSSPVSTLNVKKYPSKSSRNALLQNNSRRKLEETTREKETKLCNMIKRVVI